MSPLPTAASTAMSQAVTTVVETRDATTGGRIQQWATRLAFRMALRSYLGMLRVLRAIGPKTRRVPAGGAEILLTGTFYSDNWIRSHVYPLSLARGCRRVVVVATYPVPPMDKVELIQPPAWLLKIAGDVGARLSMFAWVAMTRKPDIVGGFHLLLNGLASGLVARVVGAQAMYFCVGGPNETVDGGVHADNRLFDKLPGADPAVEGLLNRVVDSFDLVVTMGTGAVRHYRQCGVTSPFRVVAGGIDGSRFAAGTAETPIDFLFVGRLAPVKRVDLFLRALQIVQRRLPGVQATIVGDGELRQPMEQLARELGIDRNVSFVGQHSNVETWLKKSKLFVLCSDSEGLSLSLMEAMRCGLPAVVSNTGDLGDLVEDGVNGYLVGGRTGEAFAEPIAHLLSDDARRARFSAAASQAGSRYDVRAVSQLWDGILADAGRPEGLRGTPS